MQLIAVRGGTQYLFVSRGKPGSPTALGRVLDTETETVGDELPVQSILARGYWLNPPEGTDERALRTQVRDTLRRQKAS